MFADSFLDVSWTDRSRRGYATLVSFTAEALLVAALLLVPLLYVHGLPHIQWSAALVSPPPPPAPLPVHAQVRQSTSNLNTTGQVIAPHDIPHQVLPIVESSAPDPVDASQLGIDGGTGDRMARGVFHSTGGLGRQCLRRSRRLRPKRCESRTLWKAI